MKKRIAYYGDIETHQEFKAMCAKKCVDMNKKIDELKKFFVDSEKELDKKD